MSPTSKNGTLPLKLMLLSAEKVLRTLILHPLNGGAQGTCPFALLQLHLYFEPQPPGKVKVKGKRI